MENPLPPTKQKPKSQELQEQIDKLKEELKTTLTANEDVITHLEHCPTCRAKAKAKLQDEILKEHEVQAHPTTPPKEKTLKEQIAELPKEQTCKCKGCREIVPKTSEKCPYCGCTEGKDCD
jgi:hypothetical protein